MIKQFLVALAIVGFANVAVASEVDWIEGCNYDTTTRALKAGPITVRLIPGERACAESITATDVTANIDVASCNHIDVFQFDDPDGDGDVSTIVGQPQICPDNVDDDDSCADFGLSEFSGDVWLEGLGAAFFRIEVNGTTDTAQARWEIHCITKSL